MSVHVDWLKYLNLYSGQHHNKSSEDFHMKFSPTYSNTCQTRLTCSHVLVDILLRCILQCNEISIKPYTPYCLKVRIIHLQITNNMHKQMFAHPKFSTNCFPQVAFFAKKCQINSFSTSSLSLWTTVLECLTVWELALL